MQDERLRQHHLSTAQHAAPAAVGGQVGSSQRRELAPVGEPDARAEILLEHVDTADR